MSKEPTCSKLEKLKQIVEFAKSLGFKRAETAWWDYENPEYSQLSPFDGDDDINAPREFSVGVFLNDLLVAVEFSATSLEEDDVQDMLFDTLEEAEAFIKANEQEARQ